MTRLLGKRTLVEVSHAIERFARAAEAGGPLLVVALFQRPAYLERELEVYGGIAERGAVTVVGAVGEAPPGLPAGVRHVRLDEAGPLGLEWSVTVLGPGGGATLVALDTESVDPQAHRLEDGRRFRGRWSFRRADAVREARRLRGELGLDVATAERVDAVLAAVDAAPEPAGQGWWDAALHFLAERVEHTVTERSGVQAQLDAAVAAQDGVGERDPRTGLYTPAFLARWTAGLGGGLPLGLVLLRVPGFAGVRERHGLRAEHAVVTGVTRSVQGLLTRGDRLVHLAPDDFLAVLPSWPAGHVHVLCDEVCARVARLDQQYPFVPLPARGAAVVTREPVLPVDRLVAQVEGRARAVAPV